MASRTFGPRWHCGGARSARRTRRPLACQAPGGDDRIALLLGGVRAFGLGGEAEALVVHRCVPWRPERHLSVPSPDRPLPVRGASGRHPRERPPFESRKVLSLRSSSYDEEGISRQFAASPVWRPSTGACLPPVQEFFEASSHAFARTGGAGSHSWGTSKTELLRPTRRTLQPTPSRLIS
jgi:hypothetical protein